MSGALSFDEAALLVPREGLSKNEWKRQVKQLVRESKKKAAKGKRDREEDSKQNQLQQPGEKKQKKKKAAEKPERSVRIVLDCSFEHLMTDKEIHSLSQQVRDSYSANCHMSSPCRLIVATSAESKLKKLLDLHHAHQNWVHFEISDTPFETMGEGIMYLSSDAEQVLESIPEGATIVIGGLVDRNRHKGASHAAATAKGVKTYRLPLEAVVGKKPLTTNQVVTLVCRFLNTGSWAEAIEVIPMKKRKKEKFEKKVEETKKVE